MIYLKYYILISFLFFIFLFVNVNKKDIFTIIGISIVSFLWLPVIIYLLVKDILNNGSK